MGSTPSKSISNNNPSDHPNASKVVEGVVLDDHVKKLEPISTTKQNATGKSWPCSTASRHCARRSCGRHGSKKAREDNNHEIVHNKGGGSSNIGTDVKSTLLSA